MTADAPTDRGRGPVIVLLHGVGVGPESFASVAELLEDRHPVVALERPAGPGGAALDLPDQADLLARSLDDLGAPVRLVGVSGGATLGLCLALRHPDAVEALLLHEPLVGPLAPALDRRFQDIERHHALSGSSRCVAPTALAASAPVTSRSRKPTGMRTVASMNTKRWNWFAVSTSRDSAG